MIKLVAEYKDKENEDEEYYKYIDDETEKVSFMNKINEQRNLYQQKIEKLQKEIIQNVSNYEKSLRNSNI